MTAEVRKRLSRALSQELRELEATRRAERFAIRVDGGYGVGAQAAVLAAARGPARAVEAARWARGAVERGLDDVVTVIRPDMTRDEADALIELHVALAKYAA